MKYILLFNESWIFTINDIYKLVGDIELQPKFIKLLKDFDVIKGNKVSKERLEQVYYMVTKKELSLDDRKPQLKTFSWVK